MARDGHNHVHIILCLHPVPILRSGRRNLISMGLER